MFDREIRASEMKVGQRIIEDGMDPIIVAKLGQFGDTMLVTGADGEQRTFDIDTTVEATCEYGVSVTLNAALRVWAGSAEEAEEMVGAVDAVGLDVPLIEEVRLTEVSLDTFDEVFETEDELDGEPKVTA